MMIVVTGAQGFIGQYVVNELKREGKEVWSDLFDIRNTEGYRFLPDKDIEAVVHCAALLMIDDHSPTMYFLTNTIGTYNILEYCRRVGAKLIYTMTHSDVNAAGELYITEQTPRCFTTSSYGQNGNSIPFITSKIAASEMIEAYNRSGLIEGVILRLSNIRGVGSKDTRYNSVFHQFIQKAKLGETIELWGERKTIRDLIYVKDVARAIRMAIDGAQPGLYNIGLGQGLTIEDEAKAIIDVFSSEYSRSMIFYRPEIEEVRKHSYIFAIDKARRDFRWEPLYSYKQGLEDMKQIMSQGG